MTNTGKKLTERHQELTHTENIKVISHVQRENDAQMLVIQPPPPPFK